MAIGDIRVIRWKHTITATTRTVCVRNAAMASATANIAAGDYITSGDASIVPNDILADYQLALNTCYNTLAGGAVFPFVCTIDTRGYLSIQHTAGAGFSAWLYLTSGSWTLDKGKVGYYNGALDVEIAPGATVKSYYQVAHCWYPDTWHSDDTRDVGRRVVACVRGLSRVPYYVEHSDPAGPGYVRRLAWPDVRSARIWQSAANDSTAASVAGLNAGDPNAPLESLFAYVLSGTGPDPQQVYLYDKNDALAATKAGPYYVDIPDDAVEFGGVPYDWQQPETRQRQFGVRFQLVKV